MNKMREKTELEKRKLGDVKDFLVAIQTKNTVFDLSKALDWSNSYLVLVRSVFLDNSLIRRKPLDGREYEYSLTRKGKNLLEALRNII